MKRIALLATLLAAPVAAQDIVTYDTDQSFDDVMFGLENAILGEGLVIDATSHVGDMLERTREDVGSDVFLYEEADVLSFCSASVSRVVMEADPMNIAYCPYDIFVMVRPDSPGTTTIGYRGFPEGPMQEVEALLDRIARAAIGQEE
jgi:uncharacterized protein (DUF302 family)